MGSRTLVLMRTGLALLAGARAVAQEKTYAYAHREHTGEERERPRKPPKASPLLTCDRHIATVLVVYTQF